ncbi:MAG: hypothetical protein Q8P81_00490 [Nanoarchaeota archaeon]|nr:hypothetical protein [Nanoarchaeota archaeon]
MTHLIYLAPNGESERFEDESLIGVPSLNFDVMRSRSHIGRRWYQAHEELAREDSRMLSLMELTEFLRYARDHHPEVYGSVTEIGGSWRGEWIDALFEQRDDGLYIITRMNPLGEKLDEATLRKRGKISLDGWIDNPTPQGLPRADVSEGNLNYFDPRDGDVFWLGAGTGKIDLACGRPSIGGPGFGVRPAKRK